LPNALGCGVKRFVVSIHGNQKNTSTARGMRHLSVGERQFVITVVDDGPDLGSVVIVLQDAGV
jgi:hypothetical protein